MTALIVLGCIAAYVATGALYARSQAIACWHRANNSGWYSESAKRESANMQMAWRLVFWPYALVFDSVRGGLRAWLWAPVHARTARAEQLRNEAAMWRRKQYDGTPAEKEMAAELSRLCEERAREVDL